MQCEIYAGSPPRVWGRRAVAANQVVGQRFTPTRVGTTNAEVICLRHSSVHPHACGDDRRVAVRVEHHDRFTPTRVGTTMT